jgi:hypothetical protein
VWTARNWTLRQFLSPGKGVRLSLAMGCQRHSACSKLSGMGLRQRRCSATVEDTEQGQSHPEPPQIGHPEPLQSSASWPRREGCRLPVIIGLLPLPVEPLRWRCPAPYPSRLGGVRPRRHIGAFGRAVAAMSALHAACESLDLCAGEQPRRPRVSSEAGLAMLATWMMRKDGSGAKPPAIVPVNASRCLQRSA